MKAVAALLDRYTMYQVVISVLVVWIVAAFGLAGVKLLPYSLLDMAAGLGVLMTTGIATHYLLTFLCKTPSNLGSTIITLLILFFIFDPSTDLNQLAALAAVATIAIASKYALVYRHLHIFNPVAVTAVVATLLGITYATWWVGSIWLVPLILIGGILITVKIRRFPMVVTGIAVALIALGTQAAVADSSSVDMLWRYLVSTPLLFFMFVMVTEPLTTPIGEKPQVLYGALIGLLINIPFSLGPLINSPELALLIANMVVYPFSLKGRLTLKLTDKAEIAAGTTEYRFTPSFPVQFDPGQYLEWTLPHKKADSRGIRRYFTIASSPTEPVVRLAVRHSEKGSSFKRELTNLKPGDTIFATSLKGEFVLPKNYVNEKFVFVAGGIGVTPFRSHLQYLRDQGQPVDVTMFYCNSTEADIAYRSFFDETEREVGLKMVYVLDKPPSGWTGETGYLTKEMIERILPDVAERIVYVSGPPRMVGAYADLFRRAGVKSDNIHTDYFPGLA